MKNITKLLSIAGIAFLLNSCKKSEGNYFGATPYDIVSVLDVRPLYRGQDVTLSKENLYGGDKLSAVVISSHADGNLPEGLLIVQDSRRLGLVRGISIELGTAAADYVPGDSLWIDVVGSTLTRKNGILMLTGITTNHITPRGKGTVGINVVTAPELKANIDKYESSLCIVNKAGFNPAPQPGEVISGTKTINDGLGDLNLYTAPTSTYASNVPYGMGAYVGIPFRTADGSSVQLRTRNSDDMINMGSLAQDLLITGFMADPRGGDGGNEYVQMLATKDIDFSVTPYSIVFCANAGTAQPALDAGWATGGQRTIKWNITSGSVQKGKFFYFGFQTRKINGNAGTYTFPAETNFYQKTYNTATGATNAGDGGLVRASNFGNSGPFPNSGNASGVAIFKGTTVNASSVPEDVLFIATGGSTSIYDPSKDPIVGYRICNNDWYSMYSVGIDDTTYKPKVVPYLHYRSTGNTANMPYTTPTDVGFFNMMGGVYNTRLGRWTTARQRTIVELAQATATVDSIEKHIAVTRLEE